MIALIVCIIIILYILFGFYYNYFTNTGPTPIEIDAVITHVDSSDPGWIAEKEKYPRDENETYNARKRWRWESNNEAKYCILAIKKYAPFFRKIFFVVSRPSQVPGWINEVRMVEPKIPIEIVYHKDFYEDSSHLPTFNSLSIEANIHKINGLAEYFVYFNDDCFINKTITINEFINKKGQLRIGFEKNLVSYKGEPTLQESGFYSAWRNTNAMLDKIFPETTNQIRYIIRHVPQIQRKSTHRKLRELFPDNFITTSASRFRNLTGNLTSAGLAEYYELYTGNAEVYRNPYIQVFITDNVERNRMLLDKIRQSNFVFVNIQNAIHNSEEATDQLRQFLSQYEVDNFNM